MSSRDPYSTISLEIPADISGKSLDDGVLADVIASGMQKTPCVAENHLRGRYNELAQILRGEDAIARYDAVVKLTGIALRYAWENQPR